MSDLRAERLVLLLGALVGCEAPPDTPPPEPAKADVFLIAEDSSVIGTSVHGTVSVSGCKDVAQVQLYANDTFIADALYSGNPTRWELLGAQLRPLYSRLGLATPLVLTARLACVDGRTATSQPAGVTFMPVEWALDVPGSQAVPDAFVAEGGLNGAPTTFIGCTRLNGVSALVRSDTQGLITEKNVSLPFECTAAAQISLSSHATLTRWLLEPGVGAFAFDAHLNISAIVTGKYTELAVNQDGFAVAWRDELPAAVLVKLSPRPGLGDPILWEQGAAGIINATPLIDAGSRVVYLSTWHSVIGSGVASIVVRRFHYDSGMPLNAGDALVTQSYNPLNLALRPRGTFSADGRVYYLPLLSLDGSAQLQTTVLACASAPALTGCLGRDRKWTSATFPGVISDIFLAGGSGLAAVGPSQTYFLDAGGGGVRNLGGKAVVPTGSMATLAVQPSTGGFYLLNGPVVDGASTTPVELVAVDSPEQGELWRLDYGTGEAPLSGVSMAVDDADQPWLRIGTRLVKPSSLKTYRALRGATPVPP